MQCLFHIHDKETVIQLRCRYIETPCLQKRPGKLLHPADHLFVNVVTQCPAVCRMQRGHVDQVGISGHCHGIVPKAAVPRGSSGRCRRRQGYCCFERFTQVLPFKGQVGYTAIAILVIGGDTDPGNVFNRKRVAVESVVPPVQAG